MSDFLRRNNIRVTDSEKYSIYQNRHQLMTEWPFYKGRQSLRGIILHYAGRRSLSTKIGGFSRGWCFKFSSSERNFSNYLWILRLLAVSSPNAKLILRAVTIALLPNINSYKKIVLNSSMDSMTKFFCRNCSNSNI